MISGVDKMLEEINFENINNDKLELEYNEQLFLLIKKILMDYKLKYGNILLGFFSDKNLLKIFKLNRKQYGYNKDSYLSILSLTYILIYFDKLLQNLYNAHKDDKIIKIFLNEFFEDENKLSYFCNDLVGDVFNKNAELSISKINDKSAMLLIDTFFNSIHKIKLYYNIHFGRVSNKYIINYKKEIKKSSILLNFIYKISKNLTNNDIIFIYNLYRKNIDELTESDFETLTNIVNNFSKNQIVVKPNFLIEEDFNIIERIPKFLISNNQRLIFNNFQNCNRMLKKEEIEVLTFDCHIGKYTYLCKIRKLIGSLHFCLYNSEKLIFKDRIYFLEDLNRIIILIKEHNQLEESEYNFARI